jgi:NAD(P)-dependent dehydrogenase (short-subunit alcohol dehydrogenase family)
VADVSDRAAVAAAVARVKKDLGPVGILVHAAGVAESAGLVPPDDGLFDRTMAVNARGAWVAATACLPDMLSARRGRIVFVASTAALQGFRYVAAYVASKHAVLGLARAMAADLSGKGVTVNAVCPGFLDTPMTARSIDRIVAATGRTRQAALADLLASGGQERLLAPEEVADAIVRLVSDDAADVTGNAIPV